jgi:hypothetical protein
MVKEISRENSLKGELKDYWELYRSYFKIPLDE